MRTAKTISVSLPSNQLREMERVARRENRTMSELLREAFRCYVRRQDEPATLAEALSLVRDDAKKKGTSRISRKEIDAEIAAYRNPARRKAAKP